jgi:lysophospholipase L1-like esterase
MQKDLNIVFIGGSITEGSGASDYSKTYVNLVSEFMVKKYENNNVNVINVGASGTGSNFAIFRLTRDVIEYDPDIVFIEFAVNDRIVNSQEVSVFMEGIVRKLVNLKKRPKIVILIAPTEMSDACGDVHKKIGYYYNIPVIDIQDYIWREIGKGSFYWKDISKDSLHPNDFGHRMYAEYIIRSINEEREVFSSEYYMKNNPLMSFTFNNPRLIGYESANFYGNWREENHNLKNRIGMAAVSDIPGDCITLSFQGRYLGITTLLSTDCGILEIDIDGKRYEMDFYSTLNNYFVTAINIKDLKDTEHNLVLRVSERKNPQSSGHRVIVGDFLVER